MNKNYVAKIYNSSGSTLLSTEAKLLNQPRFSKSINGGLGQCYIDLNYSFGALSSQMGNVVRIYLIDQNNQNGRLIYTGVVTKQEEILGAGMQTARLILLGLQSLLSNGYYRSGSNYVVNHSVSDVSDIFEAIIDHFNTIYSGGLIFYNSSPDSIQTIGTNVTYSFNSRKWLDALNDAFSITPGGYYWLIDETGLLSLNQNPASATHSFTVGKDVEKIEVSQSIEEIINRSYLNYNGGTDLSEDSSSQSNYGYREAFTDDQNISDSTTSADFVSKEIADFSQPKVTTRVTVNQTYDIESIQPGDTCRINNILNTGSLHNNMRIVRLDYQIDQVVLYLDNYEFLTNKIRKLIQ